MDMKKFSFAVHDPDLVEWIQVTEHKKLAKWAICCIERVLPILQESYPKEESAEIGISILEQWIHDKVKMWEARKYCWTILAHAREIEKENKTCALILRGCSHTLATCHVPTHSEGSAMYAVGAIRELNKEKENVLDLMANERKWQLAKLIEIKNS